MNIRVRYNRRFLRTYHKLPKKIQEIADDRIRCFKQNPFDGKLNNHALAGEYKDCRSINVTGDYRAIYIEVAENEVMFVKIGTHSQLYG